MKKLSITILLVFVIILTSFTNVKAEVSQRATFNLTTQNTNVKVGDEVTVTLSIGELVGMNGITAINFRKSYDNTVFEYLGITAQNGWEVKGDVNRTLLANDNKVSSGAIAILKFKALKAVEGKKIQLIELDASSADGDEVIAEDGNVNAPEVEFTITAQNPTEDPSKDPTQDPSKDPTQDPSKDPTQDPSQNPTQDPSKNPVKNPTDDSKKPSGSNTGVKNDKTTVATSKIPQTGEPYMLIVFGVLGLVLTGISYARYQMQIRKMK